MSDSVIAIIVTQICTLITALALGYWKFRSIEEKTDKAATAVTAAATTVKEQIETSVKTIEETKHIVEEVRTQTDGRLSKMEQILEERTKELRDLAAENAKLLTQVQAARGGASRREDDP